MVKVISKDYEEFLKENLTYDADTGNLWWVKKGGPNRSFDKPAGSFIKAGYRRVQVSLSGKRQEFYCHRVAWFLTYGVWPKHMLDHINGDKKDNRIVNLREATDKQNLANRKKALDRSGKPTSSCYKGVVWQRGRKIWLAQIYIDGKRKHLGHFKNEEDAAKAYNKAAQTYFGEYASLNTLEV